MNTFKKFALVTVLSAGAIMPLAAQAANNNADTPVTTAVTAPEGKTVVTTTAKSDAKAVESKAQTAPADFATLDKDHSGKLSLHEFITGEKGSEKKDKQEFAALDKNKDHKLTAEEFGALTTTK